jgi:hypothetical protein
MSSIYKTYIIQVGSHIGNTENDMIFNNINPDFEYILIEPVPYLFNQLKENYFKTILSQDDFLIEYKNNTFWWAKNSFLNGKNIQSLVRFEILKDNQILFVLNNQEIFKYWAFFISNLSLNSGYYETRIIEESTNRIIYKNVIKI